MLKITSFVYCTAIEQAPNGPALRGILQFLAPKMLPTEYSFSISFGVFDLGKMENLKVRYIFKDPDGEIVNDTNEIDIPLAEDMQKHNHIGMQLNLDLKNLVLSKQGEYYSEVYINENLAGKYPIDVFIKEKKE